MGFQEERVEAERSFRRLLEKFRQGNWKKGDSDEKWLDMGYIWGVAPTNLHVLKWDVREREESRVTSRFLS